MHKLFLGIFVAITLPFHTHGQTRIAGDVVPERYEKMKIVLQMIAPDERLQEVARILAKDLTFDAPFALDTGTGDRSVPKRSDFARWHSDDVSYVIFVQWADGGNAFMWRLYDVDDLQMVQGKKVSARMASTRDLAHHVADVVWQALTGTRGVFLTKIAFCRDGRMTDADGKKRRVTRIITRDVTDDTGESEQTLVSDNTIMIAPRWNNNPDDPRLLFSEHTRSNVRLAITTLDQRKWVVSNFDGLNMQAAYRADGQVVYCLSKDRTTHLYHYRYDAQQKRGIFRRLTNNKGNNFAPCWGPDDWVYFMTDATPNGRPRIARLDVQTGQLEWVTTEGYCMGPAYCPVTDTLAFARKSGRFMQIFLRNCTTGRERQVTFDRSSKEEASWSPCGNFLAVAVESLESRRSRIGILNVKTGSLTYLTLADHDCSYPAWSPRCSVWERNFVLS